jgi:hypothetical protein
MEYRVHMPDKYESHRSYPLGYGNAVVIPNLSEARRARLLAHIARLNQAQAARPPISAGVAHCAAALLAADRDASVPTALAQAEALAGLPAGPALISLCESVASLAERELLEAGLYREPLRRVLAQLGAELSALAQAINLEAPTATSERRRMER